MAYIESKNGVGLAKCWWSAVGFFWKPLPFSVNSASVSLSCQTSLQKRASSLARDFHLVNSRPLLLLILVSGVWMIKWPSRPKADWYKLPERSSPHLTEAISNQDDVPGIEGVTRYSPVTKTVQNSSPESREKWVLIISFEPFDHTKPEVRLLLDKLIYFSFIYPTNHPSIHLYIHLSDTKHRL